MRIRHFGMTLSVLLALAGLSWSSQSFKIDPAWSHIEFSVMNFGINTVEGRFNRFSGTIAYDNADVSRSSVTVSISIASVDTGSKKRDAHLQTADFFEAATFPEMTFRSARIEKVGESFILRGPLTIKGRTQEVALPFTFSVVKSPEGIPTLRAEAKGVINRHDFGIDYGSNFSVSKEVQIVIHIQALP